MLGKIKKLFTDNRLLDLLSGNMVITDEIINDFINRVALPPMMKRFTVLFSDGAIEAEGEGDFDGVHFTFQGGIELISVYVTNKEQIIKIMPRGPFKYSTPHLKATIEMESCPGLLTEFETFLSYLPEEDRKGIVIEPAAIAIHIHENPLLAAEFARQMEEIPLAKDLGINPLDYVIIHEMKIEPGRVRLQARRAKDH
jgi:hypothetical protein